MRRIWIVILVAAALLLGPAMSMYAGGAKEGRAAGETNLTLWTFIELHGNFYKDAAERWNAENPNRRIRLEVTSIPNVEMHNQLTLAFQSGVGAPDIVDININFFANYLRGEIPLVPLNDIVNPVRQHFVQSRFDIYSRAGTVYGLPTHVGATVVYYNMDIMSRAGINIDNIRTWDDFEAAGRQVRQRAGVPMTIVETTNQRPFWPMIVQRGSDYLGPDGSVTLDNRINIEVLERLHRWVQEGIAVGAPGGFTGAEEFFPFVNQGGMGALIMPMWYMSRFLQFMPDLKGKIAVRPMPIWQRGDSRSAGMGGTGTSVTRQSRNQALAKEFLAYAKLTRESNIQLWKILRFDPPRWDVWDHPDLMRPDPYFFNEPVFSRLIELARANEIRSPNIGDLSADAQQIVNSSVMFWVFGERSRTPAQALQEGARELRARAARR